MRELLRARALLWLWTGHVWIKLILLTLTAISLSDFIGSVCCNASFYGKNSIANSLDFPLFSMYESSLVSLHLKAINFLDLPHWKQVVSSLVSWFLNGKISISWQTFHLFQLFLDSTEPYLMHHDCISTCSHSSLHK